MGENNVMIIIASLAAVVFVVLFICIIIYLLYRRKRQTGKYCSCDSTYIEVGDGCKYIQQYCLTCMGCCAAIYHKQAYQTYTECIQSKVPTGPITKAEAQTFTDEIQENDTNNVDHFTPYQPKVPKGPDTSSEIQTFSDILKKDANKEDHVTSHQPKVDIGPITSAELQNFTEELLDKDTNNVASLLRINHQGRTNSRDTDDKAQDPLLTIPSSALAGPTIVAFRALLDNYDPNVAAKEVVNNEEIQEQIIFLNAIMNTQVMRYTEHFLTARGIIQHPLKDMLKEIWFTPYSRSGRSDGSSGFEHVFIGEIKDEKVLGFHNWIQFGHEEQDGDLDYKGIMRYVDLGDKGQVIKGRFDWLNERKPVGTLFVGTSPEFEMALYTVCFLVRPDKKCQVKLKNKKFDIQTWSLAWNRKLLGGAFPDI